MIGAGARTQWRRDLVKLNDRGFVRPRRSPRAHGRCPVRPCRSRRACQAIKTLAVQIRESARREPGRTSDRLQLGLPGGQAIRVYRK
jgi:hypothetical protein